MRIRISQITAFMLALMMSAAFWVFAFAGNGTFSVNAKKTPLYPGEILQFTMTVNGADTLTSANFTLGKYDHVNWTNFPFQYQFNANSAAGSPSLRAWLQGSFDNANWVTVDTLLTSWSTTEGKVTGTIDFANAKYPRYRIMVEGNGSNNADTTFDMQFWLYQEEQ